MFPLASSARRVKLWRPESRPLKRFGDVHGRKPPLSRAHSKVACSFAANPKLALGFFVLAFGPLVISAVGAVQSSRRLSLAGQSSGGGGGGCSTTSLLSRTASVSSALLVTARSGLASWSNLSDASPNGSPPVGSGEPGVEAKSPDPRPRSTWMPSLEAAARSGRPSRSRSDLMSPTGDGPTTSGLVGAGAKFPAPSPSSTVTVLFGNSLVMARSRRPSPSKSATSTSIGTFPAGSGPASVKLPVPSPSRIETLFEDALVTARSDFPSSFRSETRTSTGVVPTASVSGAAKSPFPVPRRTAPEWVVGSSQPGPESPSSLKSPAARALTRAADDLRTSARRCESCRLAPAAMYVCFRVCSRRRGRGTVIVYDERRSKPWVVADSLRTCAPGVNTLVSSPSMTATLSMPAGQQGNVRGLPSSDRNWWW